MLIPQSETLENQSVANPVIAVRTGIKVEYLDPQNYGEWDEFVFSHPQGSPFHLCAWKKSIEATFGYKPYCMLARRNSKICGVLPLFLVENVLMGKVLQSSPFAVYGGALTDSEEVKTALRRQVEKLANSLRVQYVELRNFYPEQALGFASVPRYVTFTQEVGPDEQAILETIPRKVRYMVRKSLKAGFSTRTETRWSQAFVDLYTENLRKLGTPAFPEKHFRNLHKYFDGMADVREVIHEGRVVSAVFSFYFRDQMLPFYGASDPAANAIAPNNYMYFDMMRWGGANGYRLFDFGRSKKGVGGSYEFKAHWGMMERELPYEILLVRRKDLPNFSPANPLFETFIRIWQKMPMWVTRIVGPVLVRLVP